MKFAIEREPLLDFVIPDEWWLEAGMDSFVKKSVSYQPDRPLYDNMAIEIEIVPLRFIYPQKRSEGTPDFIHARMVKILKGIRNGNLLPPIFVTEAVENEKQGYKYCLRNGFHRYRASVAAGFSHIPIVVWAD